MHLPLPEDNENVTDYKFPRFAATYFQNNATHVHIRRPIKDSLLPLKNNGDQLVSFIQKHLEYLETSSCVQSKQQQLLTDV